MTKLKPSFRNETLLYQQGFRFVIGCDEAGRGCLAGPVVAAAVILPKEEAMLGQSFYAEINDSKKLTAEKRFTLEKLIRKHAVVFGIGTVSPIVIDKINIHNASLLAMQRAVTATMGKLQTIYGKKFSHETASVLLDGKFTIPNLAPEILQQTIVGGDSEVLSIASSSILAKTFRDRLMEKLQLRHPEYGFGKHKGYATMQHREAIKKYGAIKCVHRETFLH